MIRATIKTILPFIHSITDGLYSYIPDDCTSAEFISLSVCNEKVSFEAGLYSFRITAALVVEVRSRGNVRSEVDED